MSEEICVQNDDSYANEMHSKFDEFSLFIKLFRFILYLTTKATGIYTMLSNFNVWLYPTYTLIHSS